MGGCQSQKSESFVRFVSVSCFLEYEVVVVDGGTI